MKKLLCALICVLVLTSCNYSTSIGNTTTCNCDSVNAEMNSHPYTLITKEKDQYGNLIMSVYYNTETKITCIIIHNYDRDYRTEQWICIGTTITMYDSTGSIIE